MKRVFSLLVAMIFFAFLLCLSACCSNARTDPSYRIEASTSEPASSPSHPQSTDAPFTHGEPSAAPSEVESAYAVWDESVYQSGSPISPQPGDTQATWQPSAAASFPADENCKCDGAVGKMDDS